MSNTPLLFTVSRLNQIARELLEQGLGSVSVQGEISNLAYPSSGHWYFSLKDKQAQIRCAMFKGANSKSLFKPQEGDEVCVKGTVSLYEPRGDYQLLVEKIEAVGDGALQRAFEQLKLKLEKEGLFDTAHKQALPSMPRCVGVITSRSGAAIADILTVLKRRFPALPIRLYHCTVQGANAAKEMMDALQCANREALCDVLILARGGGSLEDLWCFNDENLAHAIFKSNIPIVTGIGHEIDFTIADFVADKRAATPSAAAELVSPDSTHLHHRFHLLKSQLASLLLAHLAQLQSKIDWLRKSLPHPAYKLKEQAQTLDHLLLALQRNFTLSLQRKQQLLALCSHTLHAYSPLLTLSRGYAIVTQKEKVITRASHVTVGSQIEIALSEGQLSCDVISISENTL